jgi:hypothetical protein
MARAIIAFTPATDVQLVSEDLKVFYSFGSSGVSVDDERQQGGSKDDYLRLLLDEDDTDERRRLVTLALDTISTSSGGGKFIALPSDHPSSKLVPDIMAFGAVRIGTEDE